MLAGVTCPSWASSALLPTAQERRGKNALAGLARALGPCPSLLTKAARFAHLYPLQEDLAALERLGVDWARLGLTFSVQDRKARERLLRETVRRQWWIEQLRFEVQRRFPSGRRGVGGRPRARPGAYGTE